MPRQEQGYSVAYHEVFRSDGDTSGGKVVDFLAQVFAVECNAVAENVHNTLAEHARGQKMQRKLAELVNNGVACVAAALIAHDYIIIPCEEVNHSALALVAPVDAYNCTV